MTVLLTLLLFPMCYITSKVRTLVWDKDKALVLMLVCLTLSLLAFVLYYVFNIVIEAKLVWQYTNGKSYNCTFVVFTETPCFLLSLGIILNLNKWIQYCLKIVTFVRVNTQLDQDSAFGAMDRSLEESKR